MGGLSVVIAAQYEDRLNDAQKRLADAKKRLAAAEKQNEALRAQHQTLIQERDHSRVLLAVMMLKSKCSLQEIMEESELSAEEIRTIAAREGLSVS